MKIRGLTWHWEQLQLRPHASGSLNRALGHRKHWSCCTELSIWHKTLKAERFCPPQSWGRNCHRHALASATWPAKNGWKPGRNHSPEQLWLKPPPWAKLTAFSCAAHASSGCQYDDDDDSPSTGFFLFFLTPYSNAARIFKPAACSGQQKWLMLHYRI